MTLSAGANSITASDTDLAGNTGTSAAVTYTLATAATVAISSNAAVRPTRRSQTITGTVTEATESEVAGTTVTIFDNGTADWHRDGRLGRDVERPR